MMTPGSRGDLGQLPVEDQDGFVRMGTGGIPQV